MKRFLAALMCVLSLCLLSGCQTIITPGNLAVTTMAPDTDPVTPLSNAAETLRTDEVVSLYFRYMDQPYLAAEHRAMSQLPTQSWENVLISALISGPETRSNRLSSLFPEGTRLISTSHESRTLYVTLSAEILNDYADEPANWADDPYWAQEVPRRRILCMQSLAATVMENSDVDRIQVFVQQSDGSGMSTRLPLSYYKTGGDATPAPMLALNGNVLLTPDNTLHVILNAWVQCDWNAMYCYLTNADVLAGRIDERTFITQMETLPRITSFDCTSGSVSANGNTVTFSVTAALMKNQSESIVQGVIRLYREEGLWGITMTQLTGWLED